MPASVCKSARTARRESIEITGIASSHRNVNTSQVFRRVLDPPCRLVSLWEDPHAAFEAWRRQTLLPWEFRGMLKVWPVDAALPQAIQLGPEQDFEPWYADFCLNGFLNGDRKLADTVREMLEMDVAIVLGPIGGRTTLIVADDSYRDCVSIGEPKLIAPPESRFSTQR